MKAPNLPKKHAIIYSGAIHDDRGVWGQQKHAHAIKTQIQFDHKLDSSSRLNYAKVYTVEHNFKAFSIGACGNMETNGNKKEIQKLNMHANTQNDVESGRKFSKSEPPWTDNIPSKKTKNSMLRADWELHRETIKDMYMRAADSLSVVMNLFKTPRFQRLWTIQEIFLLSKIAHREGINVNEADRDAQRRRMGWTRDHSEAECMKCEKYSFWELDLSQVDEQESDPGDIEELLIYEEETGHWNLAHLEYYRHFGEQWKTSYPSTAMVTTIGALTLISGLTMGGSSMWLNAKMDLQRSSWVINWVGTTTSSFYRC